MANFDELASHTQAVLAEMRDGFGRKPRASRQALSRLKSSKPALAPKPAAEETKPGAAPAVAGITSIPESKETLDSLREKALVCVRCPHLVKSRTQVVFGVGNPQADLMLVGEAPGADEDAQGEPFVGRAGQLLTKIIEAMGVTRKDVYIGNVLKCRPDMPKGVSGNRKPKPEEMETCLPWLRKQIDIIKPKVLVALGATAVEGLLGETAPMRELRGKCLDFYGTPVIVTYHPAYLLRNQTITEKRKVWEDMMLAMEKLGWPISAKQRGFFLSK